MIGLITITGTFENITCMIEGFPISYMWQKTVSDDGCVMSDSVDELTVMTYTNVSTGRVVEFNPIIFGDEGVYHCVAQSGVGDELISDTITVTGE